MIGSFRRATVIACVTAFPFARFVHHRVAQVLGARASEPPTHGFCCRDVQVTSPKGIRVQQLIRGRIGGPKATSAGQCQRAAL